MFVYQTAPSFTWTGILNGGLELDELLAVHDAGSFWLRGLTAEDGPVGTGRNPDEVTPEVRGDFILTSSTQNKLGRLKLEMISQPSLIFSIDSDT
jgi:hypothetical protein